MVMAALAIPAVAYNVDFYFGLGLAHVMLAGLFYSSAGLAVFRVATFVLASVCSLLMTVTLSLAVTVAAWNGRRRWLAALAILGTLAVYWEILVLFAIYFLWPAINQAVTVENPASVFLTFAAPLVIALCVTLVFAIHGVRGSGDQDEKRRRDARGAFWTLVALAALAIVTEAITPILTQALMNGFLLQFSSHTVQDIRRAVALGYLLRQALVLTGSVLTVATMTAAIAVGAWTERKGWLAPLAVMGGLTLILPELLSVPLTLGAATAFESSLLTLYNAPYTQVTLAVIPCALVLVFGITGATRSSTQVASMA
jgi:hypothetical protein